MGRDSDTRNLILAAVLSMLVVLGWQLFVMPRPPAPLVEPPVAGAPAGAPQATPGTASTPVEPAVTPVTRAQALATTPRLAIKSDAFSGSIALKGGRIDDLHLEGYRETLDPESPTVILLNPTGGPSPYYTVYGWLKSGEGDPGPLPGPNTEWTVESGRTLTPTSPVTLVWDNGAGLVFHRKISVDDRYMFSITETVQNNGAAPVSLAPYGYVARRGEPQHLTTWILHEGVVGVFDGKLADLTYGALKDLDINPAEGVREERHAVAADGWLGFTDKYWMTVMAPKSGQAFDALYRAFPMGDTHEFRTEMRLPVMTVAPGARAEVATNLFAGAKEVATLRDYQENLGLHNFDDAVDWGWFYFLTKPIFTMLEFFYHLTGNMGWAIIVLTLVIKTVLFPLAYKSYVSMSKMKVLQPEMEKLKERCGDDKQKMQQEMFALYKREKVNPASGCLPILLQIPIFFSLYKVIFVSIELRHAPFIGWIQDLSAPDPTSIFNLFGLLPYDVSFVPVFLSIGVYPVLMGITMWLQQKLNPAPTDPTQAAIFAYMPWMFMFMLGSFASGLVIYWCANNTITFLQQYFIMRSQGVQVDLLGNITRGFKRKRPQE